MSTRQQEDSLRLWGIVVRMGSKDWRSTHPMWGSRTACDEELPWWVFLIPSTNGHPMFPVNSFWNPIAPFQWSTEDEGTIKRSMAEMASSTVLDLWTRVAPEIYTMGTAGNLEGTEYLPSEIPDFWIYFMYWELLRAGSGARNIEKLSIIRSLWRNVLQSDLILTSIQKLFVIFVSRKRHERYGLMRYVLIKPQTTRKLIKSRWWVMFMPKLAKLLSGLVTEIERLSIWCVDSRDYHLLENEDLTNLLKQVPLRRYCWH